MTDVLLLTTLFVAVVGLVALVRLCDRIVGDDSPPGIPPSSSSTDEAAPVEAAS